VFVYREYLFMSFQVSKGYMFLRQKSMDPSEKNRDFSQLYRTYEKSLCCVSYLYHLVNVSLQTHKQMAYVFLAAK